MNFWTINPATEEMIKEYQELNSNEIENKLNLSAKAFKQWRKTSFNKRSDLMLKAADILDDRKEEYAKLMAVEMGKPLAQGISEAEKCAWVCRYYAENAEEQLKEHKIKTEFSESFVSFQPIGSVLAIMPWNFPFWQVFRFAAPTLMAGNTGVLKHARNTMGCAEAIEELFLQAGFPEGVFTNLRIGSKPVKDIIANDIVSAVTLTGSSQVGSEVAKISGSHIKKTVMELGGADAYVVLKDADLEKSVEACVIARLINSGQSCIAAKRFIVDKTIVNEFEELMIDKMSKYVMGNPLDDDVNIGPQARKDLQLDLKRQVDDSIKKGATCTYGGKIKSDKGFYYPATVLSNVKPGMPAFEEELFGPVAAIITADNEKEAIDIANSSIYGLGGAVFTRDIEKGRRIASEELQSGACFVNDFVRSDPRLPFGGIKQSGYGRELSEFGIREFVNIKTVCVK
ncbi:NAD-dependent succinate-semialdehyde dehydrogenase [Bacteroidota bacterium]